MPGRQQRKGCGAERLAASGAFEEGKLLGFGLWADGVPIKFDRSESLEMLSLSIPGLDERSTIRLPITCINKKYFLRSGKTWDALFKVIAWSLQCMLQGRFPERFWDVLGQEKDEESKPVLTGAWYLAGDPWRLGLLQIILSYARVE